MASRRGFLRAALAGAAVAGATPLIVGAVTDEDIRDAEVEQDEVERLAQEAAALLRAATAREGALQQQLASIDRQRFAEIERLRNVNRQLETAELEVFDIKSSIANLNRALARENDSLGARVQSLYRAGRTSTLETVLSSNSFSEAIDRATSLERALAQDLEEIESLRRSRQVIQLHSADLAARLEKMDVLRRQAAAIGVALERRSQEQQDLIFGVQREVSTYESDIAAFEAEAAVIAGRIVRLRAIRAQQIADEVRRQSLLAVQVQVGGIAETIVQTTATTVADNYSWPLWGLITTKFGGCTSGQCPHIGIDIAGNMLAPVVAAHDGIVLTAGLVVPGERTASYGMIVIIAHSQTEETLYAHLDDWTSPPPVEAGQSVSRGQVIGHVGLTGWTTGPHLHFEYRKDGAPRDPLEVLA